MEEAALNGFSLDVLQRLENLVKPASEDERRDAIVKIVDNIKKIESLREFKIQLFEYHRIKEVPNGEKSASTEIETQHGGKDA